MHSDAIHMKVNVGVKWPPLGIMPRPANSVPYDHPDIVLNGIIKEAQQSAGIPSILEPAGLDR